ncbi:MAG: site-specific integrase [Planctomycetota bacterium]|nr:site-specific integrase [Planctomycetota bacterium]
MGRTTCGPGAAVFDRPPPHFSTALHTALLESAPPHRRLWYETALATGFRLNELRCLRVRDLDRFGPSLFLAADFSKDRKDHRQAITRELADQLQTLTEGKGADDRLLGIPFGPDPAAYIVTDYTAGKVNIQAPDGKATWHSLRKVFIDNVVKSGCDLKTIQALARHSTAQHGTAFDGDLRAGRPGFVARSGRSRGPTCARCGF